MSLHNIKPAAGSTFTKKRLGRGEGSGSAGTAGRGHKGAKSRSGYSKKIGFKNPNRVEFRAINLDVLQLLAEEKKLKEINLETLMQNGLAGKHDLVKVLGRGTLTAALKVSAHKFSASATAAIEAAGGSVETL
jgi:large subunit ribosomal protein L15